MITTLTIICWQYKISRGSRLSWPTPNLPLLYTVFYTEHIPQYLIGDIHHFSPCFFFFICDITPWIVTVSNVDWIYIEMVNGLCAGWLCKICWDRQCCIDLSRRNHKLNPHVDACRWNVKTLAYVVTRAFWSYISLVAFLLWLTWQNNVLLTITIIILLVCLIYKYINRSFKRKMKVCVKPSESAALWSLRTAHVAFHGFQAAVVTRSVI